MPEKDGYCVGHDCRQRKVAGLPTFGCGSCSCKTTVIRFACSLHESNTSTRSKHQPAQSDRDGKVTIPDLEVDLARKDLMNKPHMKLCQDSMHQRHGAILFLWRRCRQNGASILDWYPAKMKLLGQFFTGGPRRATERRRRAP